MDQNGVGGVDGDECIRLRDGVVNGKVDEDGRVDLCLTFELI